MSTKVDSESSHGDTVVWHITVSVLSGIIFGLFLTYIALNARRWWLKNRKTERNPEPQTPEVDPTYQELDLAKRNEEDNYQSLIQIRK